ncbi:DUF4142 domain-containing protein [Acidomonas methanolica]|uniref:DUF4142 domain-containing protein n=1 Tax=Acidomonas methanolica TaxID=437 RepID=UPI00211A0211|nr:DUF4142 domain-containing protein [Acidomonas methanolica]MCQ9156542.1 DUF4142 domain-containing protein [Acidomonas methanolica]
MPRFALSLSASLRAAAPLMSMLALSGCFGTAPKPAPAPLPPLSKGQPLTTADAAFVQALNEADLTDIALAKLAATNAARNDVRALSDTVSRDSAETRTKLGEIVSPHDLSLTTAPMRDDQEMIDRMAKLYGARFDSAYLAHLRKGEPILSAAIASAIAQSKNADLIALAKDSQSKIAAHKASAEALAPTRVSRRHRR